MRGKKSKFGVLNERYNFFILLFFAVSCFSAWLPAGTASAHTATIRISEKTTIEAEEISLGKIAKIDGESSDLVHKIHAIVIGKAPLPGKSRLIDRDYIELRLKQNDINLSQIKLYVPSKIEVRRGFIEVSSEEIIKIASDFIRTHIPVKKKNLKIKKIQVSHGVILPKGNVTYRVVPPKRIESPSTIPLSIFFDVNGKVREKVWAVVNIEMLMDVVVTKKSLGRYRVITKDDICLEKMDIANLPSSVVTDIEEVIGKRMKRTVSSKTVLRTDLIEYPPLVRRGDVVLIIAESEGLRITARGKVKSRGCIGERIKVVNLDSKKLIYARVLDSNTVKVDF